MYAIKKRPILIKKAAAQPTKPATPQPESRPERPAQFKTALLIGDSKILTPELVTQVQAASGDVEIRTWDYYAADAVDWRKNLKLNLRSLDGVIVVIDESRVVAGGVLRELRCAWHLRRHHRIFNASTNAIEKYAGFIERPTTLGNCTSSAVLKAWHASPVTSLSRSTSAEEARARRLSTA
jgi:hypothetical protein